MAGCLIFGKDIEKCRLTYHRIPVYNVVIALRSANFKVSVLRWLNDEVPNPNLNPNVKVVVLHHIRNVCCWITVHC